MNLAEMNRKQATRTIARTQNLTELTGLFQHKNSHVRHAARFKAYRLSPEDPAVTAEITKCCDTVTAYKKALAEHESLAATVFKEEDRPAPPARPESSLFWTEAAVRRGQTITQPPNE
jgi:hypothetical protein